MATVVNTKLTLEEYLIKYNIPFYRLTKMMGDNPNNSGKWINKVRGKTKMSEEELLRVLEEISKKAGVDISIAEVATNKFTHYQMKGYEQRNNSR